jgi:hypothetical protein
MEEFWQKWATGIARGRVISEWIIRRTPLICGFPDCRTRHFIASIKEVFINLILSTTPLWLGALITFGVDVKQPKTWLNYGSTLANTVSGGEMLIYATAAIAELLPVRLTLT